MEISTNVYLSENSNLQYQLLYASQNYGTFYCVYGKFNVSGPDLISVDLKLINFKGTINLGIVSAKFEEFQEEDIPNYFNLTDNASTRIKFGLFAIDIKALEENTRETISINRKLNDFKDNFISVKRNLIKTGNDSGIFDTEFYYRDGLREAYEFSDDYNSYRSGELNYVTNTIPKSPGYFCPRGYAKVIL